MRHVKKVIGRRDKGKGRLQGLVPPICVYILTFSLLPSPFISKCHACFQEDADGAFHLVDMGSTNGTTVEGIPLRINEPYRLDDGTTFDLGGTLEGLFLFPESLYAHMQLARGKTDRSP